MSKTKSIIHFVSLLVFLASFAAPPALPAAAAPLRGGGNFTFNYSVVASSDGQIVFKVYEGTGFFFTPGMKLLSTDFTGGSKRDIALLASYSVNPACHALVNGVCAPILTMRVEDAGGHAIPPIGALPYGWFYSSERGQIERMKQVFLPVISQNR